MKQTQLELAQSISTFHQRQHELVNFLYQRFTVGMVFTLVVSVVASAMVFVELSIQGREVGPVIWLVGIFLIQLGRLKLKMQYDQVNNSEYLSHQLWERRFIVGVYIVGAWQGFGALLAMPYLSNQLQFIIHTFLMGLGAGAIAYLATSMRIYGSYLVLMILPVTCYLFYQGSVDSMVLGTMQLFMIIAYYVGVRRMNNLIVDSLHLRFDNEILVNDLQRLLGAVAKSNKELNQISTTDDVTGAANFRSFRVRLEELRRHHIESRLPLTVVKTHIDNFYEYNEYYGQEKGNVILNTVAGLLMQELGYKNELVARLNGAEFGILLPEVSCEVARVRLQGIMQQLHQKKLTHGVSKVSDRVTLSVGVCCVPISENITARDLIMRTENALREAKKNGRNRIELIND